LKKENDGLRSEIELMRGSISEKVKVEVEKAMLKTMRVSLNENQGE
jgi:hypothetical protein